MLQLSPLAGFHLGPLQVPMNKSHKWKYEPELNGKWREHKERRFVAFYGMHTAPANAASQVDLCPLSKGPQNIRSFNVSHIWYALRIHTNGYKTPRRHSVWESPMHKCTCVCVCVCVHFACVWVRGGPIVAGVRSVSWEASRRKETRKKRLTMENNNNNNKTANNPKSRKATS